MKLKEAQAVKKQLQQLDVELRRFKAELLTARVAEIEKAIRRPGAAALDLAYTACGLFDGFFEFQLSAWDIAAGSVLVEEAGGTVTDYHGGNELEGKRQVCASNGLLHDEMLALLKPTVLGKTLAPEA